MCTSTTPCHLVSNHEERNLLIRALSAAMRWKAHYTEKYDGDEANMTKLSQLLEQLSNLDDRFRE